MFVSPVYVLWPVTILFGYHGDIKFYKRICFLTDSSSKTTEAVGL